MENMDPMGIHTGDSVTVAPAQTLTDKEYQRMRDAARRIIRRVGVETGGSNIQFAINPEDGRLVDVHVRRLRMKIEPDPANAKLLLTEAGGYRLQP